MSAPDTTEITSTERPRYTVRDYRAAIIGFALVFGLAGIVALVVQTNSTGQLDVRVVDSSATDPNTQTTKPDGTVVYNFGSDVTFTYTVKNTGSSTGDVTCETSLRYPQMVWQAETLDLGPIAPGQTVTHTKTITTLDGASGGAPTVKCSFN